MKTILLGATRDFDVRTLSGGLASLLKGRGYHCTVGTADRLVASEKIFDAAEQVEHDVAPGTIEALVRSGDLVERG